MAVSREALIRRLVRKKFITPEEAKTLSAAGEGPWGLPGRCRDHGQNPDLIIGFRAEWCYCKGFGHPWEDNVPVPYDIKPNLTIFRADRCLSCTSYRFEVPDSTASRRLFRFAYAWTDGYLTDIPKGLSVYDYRSMWSELRLQTA